jgi:hypothetical protein
MKFLKEILKWIKKTYYRMDSPGYLFQVISIWASLFFAGYAIYLTYEMDRTDKKVVLLQELALKTDSTNQNIITLIEETKHSQKQNEKMILELAKQNGLQNLEFQLISKQYSLSKKESDIIRKRTVLDYNKIIDEIRKYIYHNIIFTKEEFLSSSIEQRKKVLVELRDLFNLLLVNPIVYSNSENYTDWTFFINAFYNHFEYAMGRYEKDTKINVSSYGEIISNSNVYLDKVYEKFKEQFQEHEKKMYEYSHKWENEN